VTLLLQMSDMFFVPALIAVKPQVHLNNI